MMRKTSLVRLSAATGSALTPFVTQPRPVMMRTRARAASSDPYRHPTPCPAASACGGTAPGAAPRPANVARSLSG